MSLRFRPFAANWKDKFKKSPDQFIRLVLIPLSVSAQPHPPIFFWNFLGQGNHTLICLLKCSKTHLNFFYTLLRPWPTSLKPSFLLSFFPSFLLFLLSSFSFLFPISFLPAFLPSGLPSLPPFLPSCLSLFLSFLFVLSISVGEQRGNWKFMARCSMMYFKLYVSSWKNHVDAKQYVRFRCQTNVRSSWSWSALH